MRYDFLKGLPLEVVCATFNRAFADYFLPIQCTPAELRGRMWRDDLRLELSSGVFEGDELVGMMLQGSRVTAGKKTAYNGGTGVVPEFRGRGLTVKQHEWLLPRLKEQGFEMLQLEVIRENAPAVNVYRKVGFEVVRELDSFAGRVKEFGLPEGVTIVEEGGGEWLPERDWEDYAASWQHADASIRNLWPEMVVLNAMEAERRLGYIASLPNGRVMQFAVAPSERGRGIGRALFSAMGRKLDKMLNVINVERMEQPLDRFFVGLGLNPTFYQFEMKMDI